MSNVNKFFKSTGIYFVGNVLTKIISFFLLPLYTKYLATDQMGYYDLANTYLTMIVPLVCIAIWNGILRFIFDYEDKNGKYKIINNALVIFLSSLVVFSVGCGLVAAFTDVKFIGLIYILGIATMLQNLYTNISRGLGHSVVFAVSGLVGGVVNYILNIILIVSFGMKEEALFISLATGLFIQVVIMESKCKVMKNISLGCLDKNIIKEMIRYCIPLAVSSVCFWFLSGFNRVAIKHKLGLEANGIYAIAAKYTYVIGLISSSFSLAMQELLYSSGNKNNDKSSFYTSAANYYIKFLLVGLALLMPLVNISFPILINEKYNDSFVIIPLYLFATVISIFAMFIGDLFAANKKTFVLLITTIVSAIVNIAVFYLLVDRIGLQAANISLSLGFLTMIIVRLFVFNKIVKININYKFLLFGLLLYGVTFYVYYRYGIIGNTICFAVILLIALYVFRNIIKNLKDSILKRIKKAI